MIPIVAISVEACAAFLDGCLNVSGLQRPVDVDTIPGVWCLPLTTAVYEQAADGGFIITICHGTPKINVKQMPINTSNRTSRTIANTTYYQMSYTGTYVYGSKGMPKLERIHTAACALRRVQERATEPIKAVEATTTGKPVTNNVTM